MSNIISTVRVKPKNTVVKLWGERCYKKKAVIAPTPTDPCATCISTPNDCMYENCFVVNVLLFQWWQRGCSAWPWVASLTQPGARHLNQMALSQVWKLLFLHVINVLFFWLISRVDWEAFAFVINEPAASHKSSSVCARSCACTVTRVQRPSSPRSVNSHSQRSGRRISTHSTWIFHVRLTVVSLEGQEGGLPCFSKFLRQRGGSRHWVRPHVWSQQQADI